ncbi:hypothetical protein Dacet_0965 [Denitrovibrio acetiphilus DSM 12809]|jgi:hypothetical protein|uniref:DUF3450 domain-containing protein n=1 Tax=Denitrovibrio acetiphilus (strain DSM 12809 / NBRC 114555 / N2460) TaxID=522772 RepID=D4H697_DENA2|nr:DUF3450 domain-containing protein [Denitrovibrio acetiphilus]ADD67743.1 hypothetical protein Dacet_0965 [Denitrovibrio acetiphilus DSM 12809]
MKNIFAVILLLLSASAYAETAGEILNTQKSIHSIKSKFYEEKEEWDKDKLNMEERYGALTRAVEAREAYLLNLKKINEELAGELERKKTKMTSAKGVERRLDILLADMLMKLQRHIESTSGYTYDQRMQSLEEMMRLNADPEVKPQEKIRRVAELFMVEADLARFAEVYEEKVTLNGKEISGYLLRLGALGQFFTTPDKRRAAVYDPAQNGFTEIDQRYAQEIMKAARIIEKKAAPELVHLPVGRLQR